MKMRTGWQKPKLLSVFLFAAIIGAAFFYFTNPVLASEGANVGSTVIVPEKEADSDTESTEASSEAGENTTPSEDGTRGEAMTGSEEDGTKDRIGNGALTPDGSMNLVDDEDEGSGLQFITLTSRNGHYFYLVIDRSSSVENVYFLNAVDESDLLALMSDEEVAAYEEALKGDETKDKPGTGSAWGSTDSTQDGVVENTADESLADGEQASGQTGTAAEDEASKKSASPARMIVTMIIFLLGVGGILSGIYLIRKKDAEKRAEEFDNDEEMTFSEETEE